MSDQHLDQDDVILTLLAARDERAIAILIKQYYGLLHAIISHHIRDKHEVEDIIYKLIMQIWRKHSTLNINKPIAAYLVTSALNRVRNYYRDQRKADIIRLPPDDFLRFTNRYVDHPADSELNVADIERLEEHAMSRMTARVKLTYMMSRKEMLSNPEIAKHLGLTVKAVERNISIALKLLREVIGPYLKILIVAILTVP